MKTITFEVRCAKDVFDDTLKQLESGLPAKSATYSFPTPELLLETLNGERWKILKYLCGKRYVQINELATHLERDADLVQEDIEALALAGVIDRKKGGDIHFPYKEIKVEFLFKAC